MSDELDDKYTFFYVLFALLGLFLLTLSIFVCFNKVLLRRERELQILRNQNAL